MDATRTPVCETQAHGTGSNGAASIENSQGSQTLERAPSSSTAKHLACERCHNQKLRCIRQKDKLGCDRCLSANVSCAVRTPRRLGRPFSTNHSVTKAAAKKRRHRSNVSDAGLPVNEKDTDRPAKDQEPGRGIKHEPTTETGAKPADQPCAPPLPDTGRRPSPVPLTGLLSPTDCGSPFNSWLSETENSSEGFDGTCQSLYAGPLLSNPGELDALIPTFGHSPNASLVPQSLVDDQLTIDMSSPSTFVPQDPVQRLTGLHYELYQCLTLFRSTEAQKIVENGADRDGVAVHAVLGWTERLFQAAEDFISILAQGFSGDYDIGQCVSPVSLLDETADPMLDSATSLMVVGCYVRLLQTFDSFASALPAILETGFTANPALLGIRIGSFYPQVGKGLGAVILVQYVHHLLDKMGEAVELSVATQKTHEPTLRDARASTTKLRERISTTVNIPQMS